MISILMLNFDYHWQPKAKHLFILLTTKERIMRRLLPILLICAAGFITVAAQEQRLTPTAVYRELTHDTSPPLRSIPMIHPLPRTERWENDEIPNKFFMRPNEQRNLAENGKDRDPVVQNFFGPHSPAATRVNFEGINNLAGVYPPDPNADVGFDNIIETVNSSFAIYSKTGSLVYGPADLSTLWTGFPGPWSGTNDGDPIVVFDHLANRWVVTQFALPNYPNGPFYELIAVSQTSDPLGSWHRYAFTFTNMPDYPKFGLWHDGYYMSINSFTSGSLNWAGPAAAVFQRDSMLSGKPAQMVFFQLSTSNDPLLPSDLDGQTAPAGTPNYFLMAVDGSPDRLQLYQFTVNWTNTASSTFSGPTSLSTAAFDMNMCSGLSNCVPQASTTVKLDALSDRLLSRLQYRNFGTHQVLLASNTVDATGSDLAGVRWYELRKTTGSWSINQQSTYSPDATHRWMGSIAMDGQGNIALGYSASSSSMFPAIRTTGRRAADASGVMTLAEMTIYAGSGSQTGTANRWGDYTSMVVDPSDDQTFWYTNEYYATTSSTGWRTRIASFQISDFPTAANVQYFSSTLTGGNGNGSIDPNECDTLSVTIRANGTSGATGVSASLTTTTPGISIVAGTSAYPDLSVGGTGTNQSAFRISTEPSFVCGTTIAFTLTVTHSAGTDVSTFTLTSGASGTPTQLNNTTSTAIPDNNSTGVDIPITVSGFTTPIAKVTASFYITHTYDGDLNISLIGPDNTTVALVSRRGGTGENFGSGCGSQATRTTLDDAATTQISAGAAPFVGSYRPEASLTAFVGKSGAAVNGIWKLHVADVASIDTGRVHCWSLFLSPLSCTAGSGPCPPLPVQLASFTAIRSTNASVRLDWMTISEVNNYGFYVERRAESTASWTEVENSFVAGHGTTIVPQSYTFVDATVRPGVWHYRLKQVDLDGSVHYSNSIQVDMLTTVNARNIPTIFALEQNYPNPFNPVTTIRFDLPRLANVSLEVYNELGQRVATLVNEMREAGYHEATFDATNLSSGVYFYRINAGTFVQTKKLLVIK
ncbi:MAG: T9SS type A sorting domain-containing protein [Ignavibacteriae bacterium]|nr:T9SS type A sorting domain-containing protein [Ignavibacteriota bacterium]